jgi:hypothetical protein
MPPFGSRQLRPQCHCRHPPLWERTWRETNRVPGSWPMAHAGILGPAYEKTKHFLTSGYVYIYTKTHAYIYIYIYICIHTYEYYICVCGIHQNGDDEDPMISMGIMTGPPINKQNWALSTYPVSRKWPELDRINDAFSSFLILNHSRMSIYWWYTDLLPRYFVSLWAFQAGKTLQHQWLRIQHELWVGAPRENGNVLSHQGVLPVASGGSSAYHRSTDGDFTADCRLGRQKLSIKL